MAQNPDERYRSAAEFRKALRRVGRVDETPAIDLSQDQSDDYSLVAIPGETTVVRIDEIVPTVRLGPRALASIFVILLTAFAIFCSYYPWRMPPANAGEQITAMVSVREIDSQTLDTDKVRTNKKRPSKTVTGKRMSLGSRQ